MHEEKPKGFIEELQSLDDDKKKRILVVSTIVIMLIVVTVWISYFNGILASASQATNASAATSTAQSASAAPSGSDMWQTIKNGFASIENIVKGHAEYTVTPQSN